MHYCPTTRRSRKCRRLLTRREQKLPSLPPSKEIRAHKDTSRSRLKRQIGPFVTIRLLPFQAFLQSRAFRAITGAVNMLAQ